MELEKELQQYVALPEYRNALGLPAKITEEYQILAQGEYNRNYRFTHPISQKELVLRVNFGSQMHLDNQIEYEYQALKLLESSGRTPKVFYCDGSLRFLPQGVLVMEFLPGHSLDYNTELLDAAPCLADIHSIPLTQHHLQIPQNPLRAILEECEEMFLVYSSSSLGEEGKKKKIRGMLDHVWQLADCLAEPNYRCCINTELNSTNFLMNGSKENGYLVDWEKPIFGDPAQDVGHFLAPTTTFWKTDVILSTEQIEQFVQEYLHNVYGRFDTDGLKERVDVYIPVTCLRGITWCAMAWIQYQDPQKAIFNESTFQKLKDYLSDDFLERIDQEYLSAYSYFK